MHIEEIEKINNNTTLFIGKNLPDMKSLISRETSDIQLLIVINEKSSDESNRVFGPQTKLMTFNIDEIEIMKKILSYEHPKIIEKIVPWKNSNSFKKILKNNCIKHTDQISNVSKYCFYIYEYNQRSNRKKSCSYCGYKIETGIGVRDRHNHVINEDFEDALSDYVNNLQLGKRFCLHFECAKEISLLLDDISEKQIVSLKLSSLG